MSEDIRKNEISEEQLESVSGGFAAPKTCPKCGGIMLAQVHPNRGVTGYSCGMCDHVERA